MPGFPSEAKKYTATRLADTLRDREGIRALRLLARLCRPEPQQEVVNIAAALDAGARGDEVGIWRRTTVDGRASFVRVPGPEQPMWADVESIGPKTGRRVVLAGESVARGYLYDPVFNFAAAMRTMLASVPGAGDVEVVDIARLGLTYEQLLRLVASSLALDPDVLIVFAGNNWNPYWFLKSNSLAEVSERLRTTNDWQVVRTYVEDILRSRTQALLEGISQLSRLRSIPVIVVLPEFNLGAWRSHCEETIQLLPSSSVRRWRSTKREAEKALQERQWASAAAFADELLEVDGGTASTGLEILGRCKAAAGDHVAARTLLEAARDSVLHRPGTDSPRCFSLVQQFFRAHAEQNGLALVDVPRLFEEHLSGAVPDSRMFLDSCHYTVPAIRVAAAGIVERLLPLVGAPARSRRDLESLAMPVGGKCSAIAHFIAAIHNAHFRQSLETVQHHCRAAVEECPDVRGDMLKFLDAHARRTSYSLCRSFHEVQWLGGNGSAMNLAINGEREKLLSPDLMECIFESVESEAPGIRRDTQNLLKRQLGIKRGGVDLLDPAYSAVGHTFRETSRYAYHRSEHPESSFRFPGDKGRDLLISLTWRVPVAADPHEHIRIDVNGKTVSRLPQSQSWKGEIIPVAGLDVADGLNVITVCWPTPAGFNGRAVELIADELEAGLVPQITRVHGEIHDFRARLAREVTDAAEHKLMTTTGART